MLSAAPLSETARLYAKRQSRRNISLVLVAMVLAITLWRICLGFYDATELSTDEAQYWLWGKEWAWGAYSKPPLIGWFIGAETAIFGDHVWSVRIGAPIFHAATALTIYQLGRISLGAKSGAVAALLYVISPAVALGSAVMTTDTPLLFFAALAMLIQFQMANRSYRTCARFGLAVGLGCVVGLGFLAKYAMIHVLIGLCLAAAFSPKWRVAIDEASLAGLCAVLVLTPHVLWLIEHGFITFDHLGQSSGLKDQVLAVDFVELAVFWANQILVIAPLPFAAALAAAWARPILSVERGFLAIAAVPLFLVSAQALAGKALGNWAVVWILPGSLLAARVLDRHPIWRRWSVGMGLCLTLALPLVKVFGATWQLPSGHLVMSRYLGHATFTDKVLAIQRASGAESLVAQDRDLLAALSWAAGPSALSTVKAWPTRQGVQHHWDMAYPYSATVHAPLAIMVLRRTDAIRCEKSPLAEMTLGPGFSEGETLQLYLLPIAGCAPVTEDDRDR